MDKVGSSGISSEYARKNASMMAINFEAIPQLPRWAFFFGRTPDQHKSRVAGRIMDASAAIGRELTQSEKDAMSYHFAKLLVTTYYEAPIAVAASYGCCYYTRSSHGFPFYTPKPEKFNPSKFPYVPQGTLSHMAWQSARFLAWFSVCKVGVAYLFVSYALSVYSSRILSDPRLEDYRNDVESVRRDRVKAHSRTMNHEVPHGLHRSISSHDSTPEAASESSSWGATGRNTQPPSSWPGTQADRPKGSRDRFVFDEVPFMLGEATRSLDNLPTMYDKLPSTLDDVPSMYDDAYLLAQAKGSTTSKEATNQQDPPAQHGPSTQQGTSAWDRIRIQAQNARDQQAQQTGSWARKRADEMNARGAQGGTSYTETIPDEEKSYAKDQAQKEFDELLERERRGQQRD